MLLELTALLQRCHCSQRKTDRHVVFHGLPFPQLSLHHFSSPAQQHPQNLRGGEEGKSQLGTARGGGEPWKGWPRFHPSCQSCPAAGRRNPGPPQPAGCWAPRCCFFLKPLPRSNAALKQPGGCATGGAAARAGIWENPPGDGGQPVGTWEPGGEPKCLVLGCSSRKSPFTFPTTEPCCFSAATVLPEMLPASRKYKHPFQ